MVTIFKKSKIKIVVTVMSILVCLFLGTLVLIYSSSYIEISAKNYEMLERHAEMYSLSEHMDDRGSDDMFESGPNDPRNAPGDSQFDIPHRFKLVSFYSVAFAENGDVLAIDADDCKIFDEETLEQYATNILQGKKHRGIVGNLVFLVTSHKSFTLVSFMDNTIAQESVDSLFQYTLVFGGIAHVVLLLLAIHLANRIVKPLEESYQKQKQFISDAGHELKTPVSVVSTNAELLSREIGDNQWLSNIQYENERMGKLVGQLLELARTESVKPQMEYLDLSRLVAGGVLPFESVAYENGLTLNSQITDGIITSGNSTQLSQLVSILVDNAIRHARNGKEVFISLTHTRSNAVFTVINDGEPIPQEQMTQLFERFYRADEARNGEDKHYGLGLAIAKAIVEAHNGKIEVSCYDEKVCFTVQLPKM